MTALAADGPRHGTNQGYTRGGCRDACCSIAHRRYMLRWGLGYTSQLVDKTGSQRRIRALMALGWTAFDIATAAGITRGSLLGVLRGSQQWVRDTTATKISTAYDRLSMRPGPSDQMRARSRDYPPPLAWDDDTIDDPATQPNLGSRTPFRGPTIDTDIDFVVVDRAVAGVPVGRATRGERLEALRRWLRAGRSMNELNQIQGWNLQRDLRDTGRDITQLTPAGIAA